jgi:agmatinase
MHTMDKITTCAGEIIDQGSTLVTLGGDHSIVLSLLRAHAKKFGPLSVIHFDAHLDTSESEFEFIPYSHGTAFHYAIQEGLIRKGAYYQVGIRGPVGGENDYLDACELGARTITIHEIMEKGIKSILDEIKVGVHGPLYVSLDIDVADPAFAPGTGTPEIGGLTSYQLLSLIRGLQGLDLIGCDLVEVSPLYDHSEITSILAANLVFEYLSLLALKKINGKI